MNGNGGGGGSSWFEQLEAKLEQQLEAFLALAAAAGWQGAQRWSDPAGDLSLHLLVQADSEH